MEWWADRHADTVPGSDDSETAHPEFLNPGSVHADVMEVKRAMTIVLLAVSVAACSSTPATTTTTRATTTTTIPLPGPDGLIGRWERTGGNYSILQGMVVEVDDALTEGVIVDAPRNPYRFAVGDVKWSDFTEVSAGRLRMRDLVREADTGRSSYVTGVITIADDRRTIDIRFPSTGTLQIWTRIP